MTDETEIIPKRVWIDVCEGGHALIAHRDKMIGSLPFINEDFLIKNLKRMGLIPCPDLVPEREKSECDLAVTDESNSVATHDSATAKREALEWFEDLVTCSRLVSGQEPQARYIRAGILSGFYEVPSFGVDYLFQNTCSALSLFDSVDGSDVKTMESQVRARFLQLLNWIAYNYPKGIKVVK